MSHRVSHPQLKKKNKERSGRAAAVAEAGKRLPKRLRAVACRRVVRGAMRRMLVFPYMRRWDIATRAIEDACAILAGGRRPALRALLQVRSYLETSDERYLLNKLLVDDLCLWLQRGADEAAVRVFAAELARQLGRLRKEHVGLQLVEYEQMAMQMMGTA